MPTFANTQVHVTPQNLTTTLALDEMLTLLVGRAPVGGTTRSLGWRGITDDLEKPVISDVAGTHPPEIWPADSAYQVPERLAARLIWWEKRPVEGLLSGATDAWFKEGLDVLISKRRGGYTVLWSTTDSRLIRDTSGQTVGSAVSALLAALRSQDSSADISSASTLAFHRDAYLWLTNAAEAGTDIGNGVTVTRIAGMGTDELSGRRRLTNKLDGEVNLVRTSFLSAIGSDAELGPADIRFTDKGPTGRKEHTSARLNTNGSAKLLTGDSHYELTLLGVDKRVRVAERLIYRYLPLVRDGHKNDATWGATARDRLILEKQVVLIKDFRQRARSNPQYAAWVSDGGDIDAD